MRFKGKLALWSAQWTSDLLKRKHEDIGDRAFAQGYRMRPYAEGERTFQHWADAIELGAEESVKPSVWPLPDNLYFFGVDISGPARPGNVIFVAAVDPQYRCRPAHVEVIQGSSPELARAITRLSAIYRPKIVMVENNATQSAILEWASELPREYPWQAVLFPWTTTSVNKWDATVGLPGLDVEFERGQWIVPAWLSPAHRMDCQCGACQWVREMRDHPMHETTDCVMAMWFARNAIRKYLGESAMQHVPEFEFPDTLGRVMF